MCGESRKHGSEGGSRKSAKRQLACCLPYNGAIHPACGEADGRGSPRHLANGALFSGDGGIDVRGTLVVGDAVRIRMAVQAKRWKDNVPVKVVREVRDSLGSA